MKKSRIKITKKRPLFCAYRCVECGAVEVELRQIKASDRQPFVDKDASQKIANELAERKLDAIVRKSMKHVNKFRHFEYIYRFDGSCRECGAKQPWSEKHLLLKGGVFLLVLALWILYILLSPAQVWHLPYLFITVCAPVILWIISLWVIHLSDKIRICKVLDEKKDPNVYPFVSDHKSLKLSSDDPRVQAIVTAVKKRLKGTSTFVTTSDTDHETEGAAQSDPAADGDSAEVSKAGSADDASSDS